MSPIEIAMQLQRKHIILGAGIVFFGLWLCLVAYFLFGEKTPAPVNPGTVAVRSASPVATPNAPTVSLKAPRSSVAPMLHHSAPIYSFIPVPTTPKATMSSTSVRMHQTSDASVQSVGSGGGSGSIATTSGSSNGGRGIRTSSISYGGNMLALSTSTVVTAPGASEANELATMASAPSRVRKDASPPPTPVNPFTDPTPIGDVAWVLMLLLTIGWCVRVRLRKQ